MIKSSTLFISSLLLLLLTGCATNPISVSSVDVSEPVVSRPLCHLNSCHCRHHHYHHRTKLLAERLCGCVQHQTVLRQKIVEKPMKTGLSAPTLTDGFATVTYQTNQQPVIQTAPFQITVMQLEPGEKFTNISSGDPSRWSYAVATSGKEESAQQNILIKPSLPDISTNLVVTTDKRLYNVRLISRETEKLTRNVNFYYPEAAQKPPEIVTDEAAFEDDIPLSKPSPAHYRIATSGIFCRPPDWQPLRVFDDGVHTYIQFPETIGQRDLPVLLAVQNGETACVNYRFKAPYMIVDKLLAQATLVSGVGQSRQAVLLTNTSV